ncbi:metallophosphoesterase [Arthrobacter sp. ISL-30]|uniref:metallophosphoesterase n=1 Tax=Arthrobacter sp. ISL-30 TaxID=2819109 RepID=UPI001BE76D89|nr:metallophosphoesterase [Arthrobacter sp. ISL-30]MBT2513551.1 metallophosphoesterase [Arthrobacter sp. ISL-30]
MTKRRSLAVAAAALVVCGVLALASLASSSMLPQETSSPPPWGAIPSVPGELHVTAAGDYSANDAASAVLSGVGALKPDLHLALGDLSYGSKDGETAWCNFVTARVGMGFPFQLIAGNHESNGQNGHIDNFALCLPNLLAGAVGTYAKEYYVDVPAEKPIARFVLISPGIPFSNGPWDYSEGSERYNWTSAAIDGARAASIPWVVVGMHTPCISMGRYPCQAGSAITNLLVDKKVDLVLNGHEHLYQRTKQLATDSQCPEIRPNSYNPECVQDSDEQLTKGAGTVFSTVGTGGTPLRDVNRMDPEAGYFAAFSGRNSSPSHGLLKLRLTTSRLDAEFLATDGAFMDKFSIGAPAQ